MSMKYYQIAEIGAFKLKKGMIRNMNVREKILDLFERKQEKRENAITADALLASLISGDMVTREKALGIPSLAACVEYITNKIATLPIKLYSETDNTVREIKDDYRVKLLNDETGDTLDAYQMKKAFLADVLLAGNGFIYINKERNTVKSLHYVDEKSVSVTANNDPIFKQNDIYVNGKQYRNFEFIKVTRNTINGTTGVGVIGQSKDIIAVAYNALIFENNLVKNGGNKKGFLKSTKRLSPETLEDMKRTWAGLYANNQNNMMILNDGIDFAESSNSSVEMQLNQNKVTNANEICKLFNLSAKIISGTATDEENAGAVKAAIVPLLVSMETALNKDLLLEKEKGGFYFSVDTKELLKGDIEKRYRAYEIAVRSHFMQVDEVRYAEDLPALGLDFITLGLNDVLYYPKSKEIYTPNTNKTVSTETGIVSKDEATTEIDLTKKGGATNEN